MPGTPRLAIHWPQVLLAKIMASATIKSSGAPRLRVPINTVSSPMGGVSLLSRSSLKL
jgi:hypothetical protein